MILSIDKKRSIGQAAKEVGIPEHVIRFWETQFNDIKPTIGSGNRRYFYDRDIKILKVIKHYLYDKGYTIKGLQKLFESENIDVSDFTNNNKFIEKKINTSTAPIYNENQLKDETVKADGDAEYFTAIDSNKINKSSVEDKTKLKNNLKKLKVKLNVFYEKLKSV